MGRCCFAPELSCFVFQAVMTWTVDADFDCFTHSQHGTRVASIAPPNMVQPRLRNLIPVNSRMRSVMAGSTGRRSIELAP